jgi:membrane associated rhomboid family serine protease
MKSMTKKDPVVVGMIQRYVLIGAALGLYYGLFYKPSNTDPDYGIVLILSIVAAAVTVTVRFWKKKVSFGTLVKNYLETFLFYLVLLLTLAVRQLAEQLGGKFGVALVTTIVGMSMGYFMAIRKKLP